MLFSPSDGISEELGIAVGMSEVMFIEPSNVDEVSVGRVCIPVRGPSVPLSGLVMFVASVDTTVPVVEVALLGTSVVPLAVSVGSDIDCSPVRGLSSIVPSVLAVPSRGASVSVGSREVELTGMLPAPPVDPPPDMEIAVENAVENTVEFTTSVAFVKGSMVTEPEASSLAAVTMLPADPDSAVQFMPAEAPPDVKPEEPPDTDSARNIVVADPEITVISSPLKMVVLSSVDMFMLEEDPNTVVTGLKIT